MTLSELLVKLSEELKIGDVSDRSRKYFSADMHFLPFKTVLDNGKIRDAVQEWSEKGKFFLRGKDELKFGKSANWMASYKALFYALFAAEEAHLRYDKENLVPLLLGFAYPTRLVNYLEATQMYEEWYDRASSEAKKFDDLLAVYQLSKLDVDASPIDGDKNLFDIKVDLGQISKPLKKIVLSSYLVEGKSWEARVLGIKEPDLSRTKRLYDLVNEMINKHCDLDVIVLPELAVDDHALTLITSLIRGSKIMLVTGLDYKIDKRAKTVRNRMAYVVPIKVKKSTVHVQFVQDKIIPAIHEGMELFNLAGMKLKAKNKKKFIFSYNNFSFSSLICNEFLNIDDRRKLRGKIDLLFLLEWNQDIETYDSLVEATANDLHSYVVQVNNRLYGDTRIRAPYKKTFRRDIARIRGGGHDYFVIAEVDISSLRLFQSKHVSPVDENAEFKPVPTGYEMDEKRRWK